MIDRSLPRNHFSIGGRLLPVRRVQIADVAIYRSVPTEICIPSSVESFCPLSYRRFCLPSPSLCDDHNRSRFRTLVYWRLAVFPFLPTVINSRDRSLDLHSSIGWRLVSAMEQTNHPDTKPYCAVESEASEQTQPLNSNGSR